MIINSEVFEEVVEEAMQRDNSNLFYAGFIGKLKYLMVQAERHDRESISLEEIVEAAEEMEVETQK